EKVEPAVVVVVPEPAGEAELRAGDTHLRADVGEGAVAVISEQARPAGHVRDVQVGIAVAVEVAPVGALADQTLVGQAGPLGHLLERAVAAIVVQIAAARLAADEKIEPAVVVVIRPDGDLGAYGNGETGL